MITVPTKVRREKCGEFDVVTLVSEHLGVAVVPEVGAKIVRLQDARGAREWTWSADPARSLHRNASGDAFDDSPLVGVDECVPTIAPCTVDGRAWPDHGEAWSRAWTLDERGLQDARVRTRLHLRTAPLLITRELSVADNILRMEYTLESLASRPQRYAWALHPLFALREGDCIELPAGEYPGRVDSAANLPGLATGQAAAWPSPAPGVRADQLLAGTEDASLKLYLPSPPSGTFAIVNAQDGTGLRGRYGPVELLPYLGIWATRGGWNGYHHFAVEPTNVIDDRADRIDVAANPAAVIDPGERRQWFVEWAFGS